MSTTRKSPGSSIDISDYIPCAMWERKDDVEVESELSASFASSMPPPPPPVDTFPRPPLRRGSCERLEKTTSTHDIASTDGEYYYWKTQNESDIEYNVKYNESGTTSSRAMEVSTTASRELTSTLPVEIEASLRLALRSSVDANLCAPAMPTRTSSELSQPVGSGSPLIEYSDDISSRRRSFVSLVIPVRRGSVGYATVPAIDPTKSAISPPPRNHNDWSPKKPGRQGSSAVKDQLQAATF